jgi:cobalt-zinc-cadmium efflux system membrane fusion protein
MTRPALIAACAVSLALHGCGDPGPRAHAPEPVVKGETIVFPPGSEQQAQLASVELVPSPTPPLRVNGRVVWNEDRTVRVYTPFAGRVVQIKVKAGEPVKKGQVLALIASPEFGQVQTEARRAAADYSLAQKQVARMRELVQHGVAARKELEAAEAEFARAEAEFRRTQERLRMYGSGPGIDQTYSLVSPISGVVVERNINPGQELRPDQMVSNAPALFVITDPDHLWVLLDASETDLAALPLGKTIVIRSPAYRGVDFTATVAAVSDFLDPTTRSIRVRADLSNSHRLLKGEMFVLAEIEANRHLQLRLPTRAVFFLGGQHYVFVDEGNGQYTRKAVRTGQHRDGTVEILDGVNEGQRVVTEGVLLLQQMLQPRRLMK